MKKGVKYIGYGVLASLLASPTLVTASAGGGGSSGGCCPTTDAAVQAIKTDVAAIKTTHDITTKQAVTALINFEAAERVKAYQLDQQLMFMVAPGSQWAITAGKVASSMDLNKSALKFAGTSLVYQLGGLTKAKTVNLDGNALQVPDKVLQPFDLYDKMKGFFTNGETKDLASFNPATTLYALNLKTANVTPEQAQMLINMLTKPFPNIDQELQAKIKGGKELGGEDMEKVGDALSEYSFTGLSASVLSDMVARRSADGSNKTMLEMMDEYSKQRFTNPDWYAAVGTLSEAALLREIAHMLAYQSWVNYQQFRLTEQQTVLMASLNAIMAKVNSGINNMTKQMAASQAEAKAQSSQVQQKLQEQNK